MGETSKKKGFIIADDGTIVRDNSEGGKKGWIIIAVVLIAIVTIGLTMYINSSEWDTVSYYEPDEWGDTVPYECVEEPVSEAEVKEYIPYGYVDLGLPSGTLWKSKNEERYYYYEQANSTFGCQLPTKKQWMELLRCCKWTWGNNGSFSGYWVKGENNCSIFLPAKNLRIEGWVPDDEVHNYVSEKENYDEECSENENTDDLAYCGSYICSDIEDYAPWIFYFDDELIEGNYDPIEYCGVWHSVRLVCNHKR